MSKGYTKDHVVVVKILGREIPKRPALSTKEVCKLGFKEQGDKADRIVRNAYRKLREEDIVEIADRGMYRLTPTGAALAKQIKEKGVDSLIQERKKVTKAAKPAKKAAKPAKKAAKVVKAKPAKRPAKKPAKKVAAKPAAKPAAKAGNGKGALSKLRGAKPALKVSEAPKVAPKDEAKPATLPM